MHLQIRAAPAKSPASLLDFLGVIERQGINILTAGGSDLEQGGEFAFTVAHEQIADAMRALAEEGYRPSLVKVDSYWMTNEPGQLRAQVAKVTEINAASGRAIVDIAIGPPRSDGQIPVQFYSEED
jgi:hypothetical protein